MLEQEAMNRNYYVELSFEVRDGDAPADLELMVDPLMDAFEDVSGLTDVDLGVDLLASALDICIHLDGPDEVAALGAAVAAARTAIHAAGHSTPGWESSFKSMVDSGQYQSLIRPAGLATPV